MDNQDDKIRIVNTQHMNYGSRRMLSRRPDNGDLERGQTTQTHKREGSSTPFTQRGEGRERGKDNMQTREREKDEETLELPEEKDPKHLE